MKIELNGQLTKNIKEIINLQELHELRTSIIKEIDNTDRKVKIQLLDLSLDIVNSRIVQVSYDMAYSREIGTTL
tara:strand:- start:468 stop:689 length:222 start_codon:yes stop_codon:yes gene_type:complete